MAEVVISGIGQVPVGDHWDVSLRSMAVRAIQAARKDAGGVRPQAMYIGSFLASMVSHQSNLGALLADYAGLNGIEAFTLEAAGASGAAALRMGYLAVLSGFVDTVLVVGVEKTTDIVGAELESMAAQAMDYDFEATPGISSAAQAGLIMQRYLHDYEVPREAFAEFPIQAHANASKNPNALPLGRRPVRRETYINSEPVCDPLNLYDVAPLADGAAALILTRPELVPSAISHPLVQITGSSLAIDSLALHDRSNLLAFEAARVSMQRACHQAGVRPQDVDFLELCDAYSIYVPLSLEAAGFAYRGEGWRLAENGNLGLKGTMPVNTLGGQNGRGNPLGATGVYQAVEACLQLRGEAGENQLPHPQQAILQMLGGPAATAVTHVLKRFAS